MTNKKENTQKPDGSMRRKKMKKISDYLSKPLMCLSTAQYLGNIDTVYFDDTMRYAHYVSANGNLYPFSKLTAGVNAVMINRPETCEKRENLFPSPIGLPAYTETGENLGVVEDVIVGEGKSVENVIISSVAYSRKLVGRVSETLLIMLSEEKVRLPKRSKPKSTSPEKSEPRNSHEPLRIIGDYGFLLGRKLRECVYNQRGELIGAKNALITKNVVETARKYGKLIELTQNSRR